MQIDTLLAGLGLCLLSSWAVDEFESYQERRINFANNSLC